MERKISYKTRWQDEILKYFREVAQGHVTASDVYEYFRANGHTIGMTTVYRQLDNLVSTGNLNKYTIEVGSPACYEYVNNQETELQQQSCIHCKCEVCGKLIHLHCGEVAMLQEHLSEHHNFVLDPLRTVFYGVCEDCRD